MEWPCAVWPAAASAAAVVAAVLVLSAAETAAGFPRVLRLERAAAAGAAVGDLPALRARDRARHGRLLQGIVDLPVEGSSDPLSVGLYFTRIKLGTPPKEFYVQIDTGSDVLWVTCNPCEGCPKSSGLGLDLKLFEPSVSASVLAVPCGSEFCTAAIHTQSSSCTSESPSSFCRYSIHYSDGSATAGYYVADTFFFDAVVGSDMTANSSTIVFGCSDYQSGDLTKPDRAVDGIFGFGKSDLSVISQLSSRGIVPKVFSHCLKGTQNGGGILVLGEVVEPGIVYTPLAPIPYHYYLNLKSIAVNGQLLPIDPAIFTSSTSQGTIVDSGTTLAYLVEEAFDPFVQAVVGSVSSSVQSYVSKGSQCFMTSNSVSDVFPIITLTFEGGAAMLLKPEDYLLSQGSVDGATIWCIGWQRIQSPGTSILGDLVLKDKIFVYDLDAQQIGWTNYDCSLSVHVSAASAKNNYFSNGQLSASSAISFSSIQKILLVYVLVLIPLFGIPFL